MHVSVLVDEVAKMLDIRPDDIVLDATLGGGGHAMAICKSLGPDGILLGIDQDGAMLGRAESQLNMLGCVYHLGKSNFRDLDHVLDSFGIKHVNKVLMDLGVSIDHLSPPSGQVGRGFSFMRDEPLLMTLDDRPDEDKLNAAQIINYWSATDIERILREYGEEHDARRIAGAIVEARRKYRIVSSGELAKVVENVRPRQRGRSRIHPATQTFQALRIAVNDELGALSQGLEKAWQCLAEHGRIAIIAFHSLEDRIVKHFFANAAGRGEGQILTRKPIAPGPEEKSANPRSRSAKLRVIQKNAQNFQ